MSDRPGPSTAPFLWARSTITIPTAGPSFSMPPGRTFRYDPVERQWSDLAPKTNPETELGGILLWSSMCYDRHNKRFVLFGGGNVQTERGDPGTWTYTPASNIWTQLKLDLQPPQRANSRLCYDPVAQEGGPVRRRPAGPVAFGHLDLRCGHGEMGANKPAHGPSPACRPRSALAAQGQEGAAPGRLRLHVGGRLRRGSLPPAAAGSLDLRPGR